MKAINFINSIPPKTRSDLHRWIVFSLVASLATCVLLLAAYMHEQYQYEKLWKICQKLQNSKEQMLSFLQDKRTTKEQEAILKEQSSKITSTQEKQKRITALIEHFALQHEAQVILHKLEIKKRQAIITLQAHTYDEILTYIQQLEQQKLFAQVTLQELTTHDEHVQAIIHGTIS